MPEKRPGKEFILLEIILVLFNYLAWICCNIKYNSKGKTTYAKSIN